MVGRVLPRITPSKLLERGQNWDQGGSSRDPETVAIPSHYTPRGQFGHAICAAVARARTSLASKFAEARSEVPAFLAREASSPRHIRPRCRQGFRRGRADAMPASSSCDPHRHACPLADPVLKTKRRCTPGRRRATSPCRQPAPGMVSDASGRAIGKPITTFI